MSELWLINITHLQLHESDFKALLNVEITYKLMPINLLGIKMCGCQRHLTIQQKLTFYIPAMPG